MKTLAELRKTNFVLWRPAKTNPIPRVFIGQANFDSATNKLIFQKKGEYDLQRDANFPELWLVNGEMCELKNNEVYYYWFKVANSNPYENNDKILYCTDPFASVVDERLQAKNLPISGSYQNHYSPASIVLYKDQQLLPSDPLPPNPSPTNLNQAQPNWENLFTRDIITNLKPNNQLVIYEIPPRWSVTDNNSHLSTADGNFRQVEKMIAYNGNDSHLDMLLENILPPEDEKYIKYLGINALELTPPANSMYYNGWSYGSSIYMAPDYDLSVREGNSEIPKPATDFINLVKACHKKCIRFFYDAVMAFSVENPYRHINYKDFFVEFNATPYRDPEQGNRDGYGGDLVKYKFAVENAYNPNTGNKETIYPSREYLKAHLKEWIKNKGISGIRLDSVVNYDCYDFLEEIKIQTRDFFTKVCGGTEEQYLVVAEELAVPSALLNQNRVDGQWNEHFKQIIRCAILGTGWGGNNFEWTIRKLIDCRKLDSGFTKGTQAINYVTSHDVGGDDNVRLYSFLIKRNVPEIEKRIKLAFSCLFTAVGIPLILAGEEFADEQDLFSDDRKQHDPVNYKRLKDDAWRQKVFDHVRRLINLRTSSTALFNDDVDFIHWDFEDSKRIAAWKRGTGNDIVITVANFSDWGSASGSTYVVPNWPGTPNGKKWKEITQDRDVPSDWIGKEGIYPWEAKVYNMVNS